MSESKKVRKVRNKRSKRIELTNLLSAQDKTEVTIKSRECLKEHPLLDKSRPCNIKANVVGFTSGMRGLYYILQSGKNRYVYHIDDFWIPENMP